jgi:hypothetical protein
MRDYLDQGYEMRRVKGMSDQNTLRMLTVSIESRARQSRRRRCDDDMLRTCAVKLGE